MVRETCAFFIRVNILKPHMLISLAVGVDNSDLSSAERIDGDQANRMASERLSLPWSDAIGFLVSLA